MILSSSSKLHNPPDLSAHPIFDPNLLHFGHDWPSFGCYTTKGTTSGAILRPSSKLCITCQMARSNFAELRPRMVFFFLLIFSLRNSKALLKHSIYNFIQSAFHAKGHLISKCLFGVIISTKIAMKIL